MQKALDVLQKHFKHKEFRPQQEEIINSVLSGQDTFAVLPTGGGKSVCYQVPALILPGICLVISPLVALIKNQVEDLKNKEIKSIALLGSLTQNEISDQLDNCLYGDYKFLYLAPERLQQDWIVERIAKLDFSIIAIDEAHCVSQWGNDFRPSYLKIKELKKHFRKTPFIALTATATPKVKAEITELLDLKKPMLFTTSFERKNIIYKVVLTHQKIEQLLYEIQNVKNAVIIYVSTRKNTFEINEVLKSNGISSSFYHGGLSLKEKNKSMDNWMSEKSKVMVATNAFGMGIDKSNVDLVLHWNLPQNIENYYQESGRAGRSDAKANAILITNEIEIALQKKRFLNTIVDVEFIKLVYKKLNSYLQIAYGEGINIPYKIKLNEFCNRYNLAVLKTFETLRFFERQGIINLENKQEKLPKIKFLIEDREVIRYCSIHTKKGEIIKSMLRMYTGMFDFETRINTYKIAKSAGVTVDIVFDLLEELAKQNIIALTSIHYDTTLHFLEPREDDYTISKLIPILKQQNELKIEQFKAVLNYVENNNQCKNQVLLAYFGEKSSKNCGQCSFCTSKINLNKVASTILETLKEKEYSSTELKIKLQIDDTLLLQVLKELLEAKKIKFNNTKFSL